MTDYAGAKRDALRKASEHILEVLRRESPSDKIGASWRLLRRLEDFFIRTDLIEAEMTELNKRHPLFGNKKHWYRENERNPSRTHWARRALDEAADEAEEQFANAYLERIAATSRIFDLD